MELVKTGLYVISGGGSNSVLRMSANGLILVDGKQAGACEALTDQVERVSNQVIRAVILTDSEAGRTGTNPDFLKAGTQILAHKSLKHESNSAVPAPAWPTLTFDSEFGFTMGGAEVRILHFATAQTAGNSVVFFPNLKAVAVGELFTHAPNPGVGPGGSATGWSSALAEVLKLDFDVAVPGYGRVVSRSEVQAFKAKIDALAQRSVAVKAERGAEANGR